MVKIIFQAKKNERNLKGLQKKDLELQIYRTYKKRKWLKEIYMEVSP